MHAFGHWNLRKAAAVAGLALLATTSARSQPMRLAQTVELPSVTGRIDHLDIDLQGQRLFVAALGASSLEVIDLRAGQRTDRRTPFEEPQGVAYLPSRHRVVVASGGSGRVEAFGAAKSAVAVANQLEDADNLRYDPRTDSILVGYGRALAVLDPQSLAIRQRIELAGHPEAFELEPSGQRIFVNVPSAGHIAVIDRLRGVVATSWSLKGLAGNFAMALDEASHRLFVATRRPARLLAYDTESGRRVDEIEICGDADDLFFDGRRRQLYAVCGEGRVDVIQQRDADHYAVAARVATAPGARTGLFVPRLSTLFVAVPARGGASASVRVYTIE